MVASARRRRRFKPRDRPPSKTNLEDGLRAWDYAAGRRRQHQNKSLRPGHDCCAVCLRLPMLSCEACGRVSLLLDALSPRRAREPTPRPATYSSSSRRSRSTRSRSRRASTLPALIYHRSSTYRRG